MAYVCFLRLWNQSAITAIFMSFETWDPVGDIRAFLAYLAWEWWKVSMFIFKNVLKFFRFRVVKYYTCNKKEAARLNKRSGKSASILTDHILNVKNVDIILYGKKILISWKLISYCPLFTSESYYLSPSACCIISCDSTQYLIGL